MPNNETTIVKTSGKVAFLSIVSSILNIPSKILIAYFLQPVGYGYLGIANLMIRYSSYADLGVQLGMSRKIPQLLSKNKYDEANDILGITAFWMVIVTFLLSFFFISSYIIGVDFRGLLDFKILLILLLLLIPHRLVKFFSNANKSYAEFRGIVAKYAFLALSPILALIFAYYYNFTGVLIAELIIFSLIAFSSYYYFRKIEDINFKLVLSLSKAFSHLKNSFVLYKRSFLSNISQTFEIVLVPIFLSVSNLGLYFFAMTINTPLRSFFGTINDIIERQMLFEFSKTGSNSAFKKYFESNYAVFFFIVTLLLGLAFLFLKNIILFLLKSYEPAIEVSLILVIEATFLYMSFLSISYLNASGKLSLINNLFKINILSKLLLLNIFLLNNLELVDFAIISLIGSFLIFSLSSFFSFKSIYGSSSSFYFMTFKIIILLMTFYLFLKNFNFSFFDSNTDYDLMYITIYLIIDSIAISLLYFFVVSISCTVIFYSLRPDLRIVALLKKYTFVSRF